jgi:hypothetical protein
MEADWKMTLWYRVGCLSDGPNGGNLHRSWTECSLSEYGMAVLNFPE